MKMQTGCFGFLLVLLLSTVPLAGAEEPNKASTEAQADEAAAREKLAPLQAFVGAWKGSGQVKRGSTEGAWLEQADWAWDYKSQPPALVFQSPDSKVYVRGKITAGDEKDKFVLSATPPGDDAEDEIFTGELGDGEMEHLHFTADKPAAGRPIEIILRLLARGRRLVMIYQKQGGAANSRLLLAEVGYTRKGSNFGIDDNVPECVMTGGDASIPVTHNGKTYYVCCTGCRDYFLEHPEKVLAEYQAKLEARKKKSQQ